MSNLKLKSIFALLVAAVTLASLSSTAGAQVFSLTSADINANQSIGQPHAYNGFGCTGGNISPALSWSDVPAGTKSLAVMVHDPDAATGGAGFWHWVVVNLPPKVTGIVTGAGSADGQKLPEGARQIATDFGSPAWGGPCPPVGDKGHRYQFTVYALKVEKLELPPNATASLTGFMVNANAIGKASFMASYGR